MQVYAQVKPSRWLTVYPEMWYSLWYFFLGEEVTSHSSHPFPASATVRDQFAYRVAGRLRMHVVGNTCTWIEHCRVKQAYKRWRRNEFQSGGGGGTRPAREFFVVPLYFRSSTNTVSRFDERFRDGQ